jgi:hypothetical protein
MNFKLKKKTYFAHYYNLKCIMVIPINPFSFKWVFLVSIAVGVVHDLFIIRDLKIDPSVVNLNKF